MKGTVSSCERGASRTVQADEADRLNTAIEPSSALQAARKLETLTKKVESFFVEQFRQLDALLASRPTAPAEASSDAQRAELLRQQTAWERQKYEEFQRIEQERELLGEAWSRVEAEQRRIMAEDSLRRAQASTAREWRAGVVQPATSEVAEHSAAAPSPEANGADVALFSRDSVARESALVEYEQLKSDVQKHARRLRRAR